MADPPVEERASRKLDRKSDIKDFLKVRGGELPDPRHLMAGSGKLHRHVQLRSTADLKNPGLTALLEAAVAAWKRRTKDH